jgi:phage-related protein
VKPLIFIASSRDDLYSFPRGARRAAGYQLDTVQRGLEPSDWRPMKAVGRGAREIRVHVLGEWRVIYVAELRNAVYVLRSFQGKSRKTVTHDIELARQRFRQIGR